MLRLIFGPSVEMIPRCCCCCGFIFLLPAGGGAAAVGELVNKQPKPTRFPCFATLLRCCFFFVGFVAVVAALRIYCLRFGSSTDSPVVVFVAVVVQAFYVY